MSFFKRTWRNMPTESETDNTAAMNRLADEIHALRLELTPTLRKQEMLQDREAERKLQLIHIRKKAGGKGK